MINISAAPNQKVQIVLSLCSILFFFLPFCSNGLDTKDPVDVIELGSRQRPVGSITAVKMLGDGWVNTLEEGKQKKR